MDNNSCSLLAMSLNGATKLISKTSCDTLTILSEPNLPSILRASGVTEIACTGRYLESVLIPGTVTLRGLSGDEIALLLDRKEASHRVAELPLIPPSNRYRGPFYSYVKNVLSKLANVLGAEKIPLVTDIYVTRHKRFCRPRLGCMPKKQYKQLGNSVDTGTLYPRIIWPTILGWARARLRRPKKFSLPFLCVGRKDYYINIICIKERCEFRISREGVVKLLEGEAIFNEGTRCARTKLYLDYLLGNIYGEDFEVKKPALWSPTAAIPLGVTGEKEAIELCLWNPYPFPKLHEVVVEEYRIVEAYTYSSEINEWERLEPRYNRVNIGIPGLGLARLRLTLRKIPPLLRRR